MQAEYGGAMLNRALYALESAWHVQFKAAMLASTAWLPHDEGMNSLMFSALQRRVRSLARQGVHRTALEWAKLTLGLDTDDPCGMLFHIDYFCLRARECAASASASATQGLISLRLHQSYALQACAGLLLFFVLYTTVNIMDLVSSTKIQLSVLVARCTVHHLFT
jgi:Transcriptional repressor TCF25